MDWEKIYNTARYYVMIDPEPEYLRIGRHSKAMHAYLKAHQHSHYTIITPYNPMSEALPEKDNHRRLEEMLMMIRDYDYVPSVNIAPADPGWDESGFCLFDVSAGTVEELIRRFEQRAWVVGSVEMPPTLRWFHGEPG